MNSDITVIIQTHNEAYHIEYCIASAKLLTSNILLIDMESSDKTVELARRHGAICKIIPYEHYVEMARDFAISQATTDWVFLLDADERISDKLASEINKITSDQSSNKAVYKVPRLDFYGEKLPLRHGGWWPNYQFRLIYKPKFKSWPKRIHATPEFEGEVGFLKHHLLHYSKGDFGMMVEKTLNFEDIESELLFKADREVSVMIFFRKFLGELYRRLIKNKGFLDGAHGVLESFYQAFSKTITYLLLYEKKLQRG